MSKTMIVSFPSTKIPSLDEIVGLKQTIIPTALKAINDIDSILVEKYQNLFNGKKLIFLSTKINENIATKVFLSDHNGKTVKIEHKEEDPFSYFNKDNKKQDIESILPEITTPTQMPDLTF